MKKFISLMLSLSMIATFITVPVITASAASSSDEVVLFSDDFEGYASGISFTSGTYGKYWANNLASDKFKLFAGLGGGAATATGFSGDSVPREIAQIATAAESGIGTGSSLKITAQFQAKKNQLTRYSGITESAIADKNLVFKTTFTVPEFVGFADGIGVYLAPEAAGGDPASDSTNFHLSTNTTNKAGELMYLGARSSKSNWGQFYSELGNGTVCNQLWTFGEKVADLEAGETYTYTVTMTPDEETGKYVVETDLNGTKLTLGQSAYAASSTVPTIEAMADFTTIKMMHMVHEWYFTVGYCNNNIANMGTTTIGVTNSEGKYDNDRTVAYFDDMSLKTVSEPEPEPEPVPEEGEPIFTDDFESYTNGVTFRTNGYGKYWENILSSNNFQLFAGLGGGAATATGFSGDSVPSEIAQIATAAESGIGTGSSLKITSQFQAKKNQLTRYSGITETAIADKNLVFKTTFTVPEFVGFADGVGVYLAPEGYGEPTSNSTKIHLSTETADKAGELMYLGARSSKSEWGQFYSELGNGTVCNQLWTFGEKVADLEAGETYTYIVTMFPDEETGKYVVETDLNGTKLTLGQSAYAASSTVPTIDAMAGFTTIRMMRLIHEWYFTVGYCNNNIANMGSTTIGVTNAEGLYDNDRVVAYFDDMSLRVVDPVNMKAIASSLINAYATVEGTTATVKIHSGRTANYTPVVIAVAYDSNDTMLKFVINDTTVIPAGDKATATLTGLPAEYAYVKVLIWDTMENLEPLTECYTPD